MDTGLKLTCGALFLTALTAMTLVGCDDSGGGGGSLSNQDQMQMVIEGRGAPDALDYVPGPGLHRIIRYNSPPSEGCSGDNCGIPDHWTTFEVSEAELVLDCTYTQEPSATTCSFRDGYTATLSHVTATYSLYVASTGALLDQRVFAGDRQCPFSVFYSGDFPSTVEDEINTDILAQWLRPYVEP